MRVTIIDKRPRLLSFVDAEIMDALVYHLRQNRVTLRLGEEVSGLHPVKADATAGRGELVKIELRSGKQITADKALYSIGRTGATEALQLERIGIKPDDRGRIAVNANYQTLHPHIYAVGDVVGFPSLASTSMEQGRLAAGHMFGQPTASRPSLLPYGIYTIPEISMVGRTEQELTSVGVPYETGIARYEEVAKGQIVGDETGMLKILFHPETLKVLGVHAIGENATEIIHIGQTLMALDGTIEFFRDSVFNYPTFAEAYKVAALNGLNKLCTGFQRRRSSAF